MKVLFILNADYRNKSGLYNASINRLKALDYNFGHNPLKSEDSCENSTGKIEYKVFSLVEDGSNLKRYIKKLTKKSVVDVIEDKYIDDEVEIKNISFKKGIIHSLSKKFNYSSMEKYYIRKLKKQIGEENYDIIHAHWVYPHGYVGKTLSEIKGIPYVVTAHGTDINNLGNCEEYIKRKTLDTLESAKIVFFVSNALLNTAIKYGYSGKNAVISNNGVEKVFLPNLSHKEEKRHTIPTVCFVGNLVNVKGVTNLPKIFKNVISKTDCIFKVIGDGVLKREIKEECENLDVPVYFTGKIPFNEVMERLVDSDILVLPSKNEGFPCVVIEANACGTYVIGSDRGGIPEAISEYGSVIKYDKDFIENFSNEIVEVLNKGYSKEKLINYAKNFTWDNIVKREVEIYNKILR